MNAPGKAAEAAIPEVWTTGSVSRVPYRVYTDEEVYKRELERLFYSGHWCYVGLAAEIPDHGDFKRTFIGERQVIMVRDADGGINVVENRCAHRGVVFCQQNFGNAKDFTCPYHQWNYDLKGNLSGLPFRRGVKVKCEDGSTRINGGMPKDFRLEDNGLVKLKVAVKGGVVFASFDHAVEDFDSYLGEVKPWFERAFGEGRDGRGLKILGYSRQRIPGNWKLMQENIKDPYHPGLLHTWFVTFGLWRADQRSEMVTDRHGRHGAMVGYRNSGGKADVTQGVSSFKEHMSLHDERVLDVVPEAWWNGPTACMQTIFPSLIIQHNVNSVSTRQIIPLGPNAFDFVWTHFGFADEPEDMTRRRLRQANLFGPAGYVSADDGEVVELSQDGFLQSGHANTVCELDGTATGGAPHNVTETLIRGMYAYYRKVMEL
jgi:salicylate 5-hydroxylase large subunit